MQQRNKKRIYRSRENFILAGVCGGLAEFLDIDSTIVRLVFIALTFFQGPGLIIYIIMAIIVPKNPEYVIRHRSKSKEKRAEDFINDVGRKTKKIIEKSKKNNQ